MVLEGVIAHLGATGQGTCSYLPALLAVRGQFAQALPNVDFGLAYFLFQSQQQAYVMEGLKRLNALENALGHDIQDPFQDRAIGALRAYLRKAKGILKNQEFERELHSFLENPARIPIFNPIEWGHLWGEYLHSMLQARRMQALAFVIKSLPQIPEALSDREAEVVDALFDLMVQFVTRADRVALFSASLPRLSSVLRNGSALST